MLEKIGNISLDSDLRKSKKGLNREKYQRGIIHSTKGINDSISFSPASKYLTKANWILKDFKQSAEEKIILEFSYSGFDFEVSLDLQTVKNLKSINYKISQSDSSLGINQIVLAVFRVDVRNDISDTILKNNLNVLEQLFKRFRSLELSNELNIYNYELINTLMDGMYEGLKVEFEYLNNILLSFLEKITNKKIFETLSKLERNVIELNLQQVKPLNCKL
ncbi:MAG: hypothetical protein KAQ90_07585 [Melioribacteraceae bacterium]|nr:hypothetical protein [Melioribacteraceae bacterium]